MNTKLINSLAAGAFALFTHSADAQTTPVKSLKAMEVTLSPPGDVYTSVEVPPHFWTGLKD